MSAEQPDDRVDTQPPVAPAPSPGSALSGGPSPQVQETIGLMTKRMETVIEAAERAADAIRRDADERARAHLAEAQRRADLLTAERVAVIAELTDELIRHAEVVRSQSERMIAALEEAVGAAAELGSGDQPSSTSREASR